MKPLIGLTMGDPGGIGPEIILKSLTKFRSKHSALLVIGSRDVFKHASRRLKLPFHPKEISSLERPLPKGGNHYFLDISKEATQLYKLRFRKMPSRKDKKVTIGKVSRWNACLAYAALELAAREATCKKLQAIVTAPIHKGAMRLLASEFVGHTEYLAKVDRARRHAMMFVSDVLCVTLQTIHLPLKKVAGALRTPDIKDKIWLTNQFLKHSLKIKSPLIGVAALNPHGSEFGQEESSVIAPAVKQARKAGIRVTGPLPGDQVFFDAYEKRLDAVVAMYHDQGLAPFKMIAFHDGVNVTLGLSYLRTSPDHGTAFDIAYRGKAIPTAFLNAMRLVERTL